MRFMIIRKADADTEAGMAPTRELAEAMMDYHEEMAQAGIVLGGDGLKPTSQGARLKFKAGKPVVTDGPFAETKEVIAGYTLIEAPSLQAAVDWAKRWPPLDGGGAVELEIRQLYEIEDFGDAFTPERAAQAERILRRE